MQPFRTWIDPPPRPLTPQASYRKTYGTLPFRGEKDLQQALPAAMDTTMDRQQRVSLILGALAKGLEPQWVQSHLAGWGIHPVSIVLGEADPALRKALKAVLIPDQSDWDLGSTPIFRGAVLPPGLLIPCPLRVEGNPDLVALPEDLITPCLVLVNCQSLRSLAHLPPGVAGLAVENAQNLVELPESLTLKNGFQLTACPRLEQLPEILRASSVKITHCQGLRSISAKIRCGNFELAQLINLTDLDLDLAVKGHVDMNLPSLRAFRGQVSVCGRLSITGASLRDLDADCTVGDDAVVEQCPELESMAGIFHVKRDLRIQRSPKLVATPTGFVGGNLELSDLTALECVDPGLIASTRTVRIHRCASLKSLPYGAHLRGSMELLDLPALCRWPDSMNVGILTVLGCPELPDPPRGVIIRAALRRAGLAERGVIARVLVQDSPADRAAIEVLRCVVRTLKVTGVPLEAVLSMLEASGDAPGDVLVAAAAEGLGLDAFLDRCVGLIDGKGGEAEAALVCTRASIHPGSLALVVKDLTKARWVAELLSDSRDLAAGVMGNGSLKISGHAAWDLPDNLAVPGQIKAADAQGPARWPQRLRVLGGYTVNPPGVQAPPGA